MKPGDRVVLVRPAPEDYVGRRGVYVEFIDGVLDEYYSVKLDGSDAHTMCDLNWVRPLPLIDAIGELDCQS